ncbi:MAG: membrane protein insertase YidC [Acidobacteria bacterium]|nr:MAG: membrane protein insertase YidC [Acidobacteriota bacterium]
MEKRVLLAVFLSFLVLYAYQSFVLKPPVPGPQRTPSTPSTGAGQAATAPKAAPGTALPPPAGLGAAAAVAAATTPPVQARVAAQTEQDIVVETRVVRAVFTNKGGRIKSWQLKRYLDKLGRPQELVPVDLPAGSALPFDLKVDDAAVTARLREALFQPGGNLAGSRVDVTGAARTLRFDYEDGSGVKASKVFTFEPESYMIGFDAKVEGAGRQWNPTILWGPGLGDVHVAASSYEQKPQGMIFRGDKVDRLNAKAIAGQPVYEDRFAVAGVDDHYFIAIALPKRMVRVSYEPLVVPDPSGDPKKARNYMAFGLRQAESPASLRFFFGPKDFDVLKAADKDIKLVRAINYGMLDIIVVPLLSALKWVNGFVGNYGWSIIILTILINIVMFPLRHKSMVSMRKMQELQPEMKAIQERYGKLKATDPEKQKMNAEVMNLYKTRGVNPAAGCVPMLLTLPVLFAFYSLLSQAIEMRGAPFMLWIQDLAAHDPLYITPILMGASQFWQQKMTPTSPDPNAAMQQKMMLMMPLVFMFMFLWAPSGLVIYWFASNLLAIGQQYLTNHLAGPAKVHAQPPAVRKVGKVGRVAK